MSPIAPNALKSLFSGACTRPPKGVLPFAECGTTWCTGVGPLKILLQDPHAVGGIRCLSFFVCFVAGDNVLP